MLCPSFWDHSQLQCFGGDSFPSLVLTGVHAEVSNLVYNMSETKFSIKIWLHLSAMDVGDVYCSCWWSLLPIPRCGHPTPTPTQYPHPEPLEPTQRPIPNTQQCQHPTFKIQNHPDLVNFFVNPVFGFYLHCFIYFLILYGFQN